METFMTNPSQTEIVSTHISKFFIQFAVYAGVVPLFHREIQRKFLGC